MSRNSRHAWRGMRKFERHSLVLAVAGTIYILIGISYLVAVPTPQRVDALHYALYVLPYNEWGWVFILVGLLALISSRWPPVSDTWGYQALTGQSVAWSSFYLFGVIFHGSSTSNFSAALLWGMLGFMWWAISGLVNPNNVVKVAAQLSAVQSENLELHRELIRCLEEKEE